MKNNNEQIPEPVNGNERRVEIVESVADFIIDEIKKLDDSIMPEAMRYEYEDLKESFDSQGGVHLLLKDEDGNIAGYITSMPKNEEYEDLHQKDESFTQDENSLYLESILIKDGNIADFIRLFGSFLLEAKKRGYKNISMHARISQGLSNVLQKRYKARFFRRIENWYDFGESFDYLEIDLEDNLVNSKA